MTAATLRASRRTGPATALLAPALLLAVLAATAGLGPAGEVIGLACAAIMAAALTRAGGERLGPASWVTLARATLAVGVAALAADSFTNTTPVALLVALAAVALALDAADGWVARRTGTATALGARFDGEVDAFLILALSVYAAGEYGAWVLAIGLARYAFLAGEWLLPWMRTTLPRRRWRRAVAAAQGDRADRRGRGRPAARDHPDPPRRRARLALRLDGGVREVAVAPPPRAALAPWRRRGAQRPRRCCWSGPRSSRPTGPTASTSAGSRGSRSSCWCSSPWPRCCPPPRGACWPSSRERC